MEIFRHLTLEGEVVAETTDGEVPYLVVRVPGLAEALIVPLGKADPFFEPDGALTVVPAAV
jgi:hypothetical protein